MSTNAREPILIEVTRAPVTIISEGKDGDGRMQIKARLLEAGIKNRNNRVYPVEIVQREVGKLQERIAAGVAFGSGGHPQDGMTSFNDISHVWRKIWMEGSQVFGEATVLNAGRGKVLQEVIRVTGSVPRSGRGVGPCARGQFNGEPADIVESSYQMVTADVVLNDAGFEDAKVLQVKEDAAAKEGGAPMDLKELKEKHPDLVKALADEVTAKVKPEIEAALAKQYEEKVLAKIGEEKDAIREAVEKEVAEKFHVAAMLEALEAIAVAVAPFAGPEDDKDKVPAADAALKATVDQLQKELNKVGQGLKEAQEREAKLLADLEAAKGAAHIGGEGHGGQGEGQAPAGDAPRAAGPGQGARGAAGRRRPHPAAAAGAAAGRRPRLGPGRGPGGKPSAPSAQTANRLPGAARRGPGVEEGDEARGSDLAHRRCRPRAAVGAHHQGQEDRPRGPHRAPRGPGDHRDPPRHGVHRRRQPG